MLDLIRGWTYILLAALGLALFAWLAESRGRELAAEAPPEPPAEQSQDPPKAPPPVVKEAPASPPPAGTEEQATEPAPAAAGEPALPQPEPPITTEQPEPSGNEANAAEAPPPGAEVPQPAAPTEPDQTPAGTETSEPAATPSAQPADEPEYQVETTEWREEPAPGDGASEQPEWPDLLPGLCRPFQPAVAVSHRQPKLGAGLFLEVPPDTPVMLVLAAQLVRLHPTRDGTTSVYLVSENGAYTFTYSGLSRVADGLAPGQTLACGSQLGLASAQARFAAAILAEGARWWEGKPTDPKPFLDLSPVTADH